MTNPDTSTLNGALEQLGITMADNLVTMGVTDARPSDGLTTLAGKILDIPVGPVLKELTVTSTKDILSYYDSESATLTATYTENGAGVAGKTVSFTFLHGSTTVETQTATTDSNGECTVSYSSKGAGDLNIQVECMSVTETYVLEDCIYYNTNQISGSRTFNVPLPSTFSLEYVLKQGASSYSSPYIDIGDNTNNRMLVGQYARAGGNGLIIYKSSNTTHAYSTNIPVNQENTIHFTYDGTNYSYSLNDGATMTVSDAGVTLTKLIHQEGSTTSSNYIKNIKIKPL